LVLGLASLLPALQSGEPPRICGSHDFGRESLDDRHIFRNEHLRALAVEGGRIARLIDEIGQPQWTNKPDHEAYSMKWVHGGRESAIDYFCDGTSQLTYATEFIVLNIKSKGETIDGCSVYDDTHITRGKVEWSVDL
jgi:hypothetical protein